MIEATIIKCKWKLAKLLPGIRLESFCRFIVVSEVSILPTA